MKSLSRLVILHASNRLRSVLEENRALGAAEAFLRELKVTDEVEQKFRETLDSAIDKSHPAANLQKCLNVWRNTAE